MGSHEAAVKTFIRHVIKNGRSIRGSKRMGNERLEIREEILKLVTSEEAERVTRYLSLIYLRLVRAHSQLCERKNVLRFTEELRGGHPVSAWDQLIALVKVSPRTAKRALSWLHIKGVITLYTTDDKTEILIALEGLRSEEVVSERPPNR